MVENDPHSALKQYQRKNVGSPKSNPYLGLGIVAAVFVVAAVAGVVWYNNAQEAEARERSQRLSRIQEMVEPARTQLKSHRGSLETIAREAAKLMAPVESAVEYVLDEPLGSPPATPGAPPPPPPPSVATKPREEPKPAPAPQRTDDRRTPAGIMSIEELERRLKKRNHEADPAEDATPEDDGAAAEGDATAPEETESAAEPESEPEIRKLAWELLLSNREIEEKTRRAIETTADLRKRVESLANTRDADLAEELQTRITRGLDELSVAVTEIESEWSALPTLQARILEMREEEEKRRREEAEQRARIEKERARRERIRAELAEADAAISKATELMKQNRFEEAAETVATAIAAYDEADPRADQIAFRDAAARLFELFELTLAKLESGLRWGWKMTRPPTDIVRADALGVELRATRVPWERIPVKQMLVFFEHTLQDKEIGASRKSEFYVALAYYCNNTGNRNLSRRYIDLALSVATTPTLRQAAEKDVRRILPNTN